MNDPTVEGIAKFKSMVDKFFDALNVTEWKETEKVVSVTLQES